MSIDFELDAAQLNLREQARAVAQDYLRPRAAGWDAEETFPEDSYQELCARGLTGLTVPVEYGGRGLSVLDACLVLEEVARGCLASAMTLQMNLNGPPRVLAKMGTAAQRAKYLPGAVDGSHYFAVAMTEPWAGSDGTALRTTLRPDGRDYRLSGTKCFITGGTRADTFLVFARSPETQGAFGICAVLVDSAAEGFECATVEPKMGGRGVPEAVLRFHDLRISAEDIVFQSDPQSTRGASLLVRQFNPERCGNAAMCIGVAQAALDDAIEFAKSREQFGRSIVEFQGLQWKLADMALAVESARLLTWRAAKTDDGGFPRTREVMMAKIAANEMGQRVTNDALQIAGHRGYSRNFPFERYFRDVRGMGIAGGTPEVMRTLLAGEIVGRRFSQRLARVDT